MRVRKQLLTPALAVLAVLAAPCGVAAQSAPTTTTTTTSTTSTPAPVPAPAPANGIVRLEVEHTLGHPGVGLAGHRLGIWGRVRPYVAGLHIRVRLYLDGREVASRLVAVTAVGNGSGQFRLGYTSRGSGLLKVVALRKPTATTGDYDGQPVTVRVLDPDLTFGAGGPSVRALQRTLAQLHYAVPQSGTYDELTDDAVVAFRGLAGLPLAHGTDATLFEHLLRGEGTFHVRYPGDGRHVEADLTRQVLAEIDPHGRVYLIYRISSGKPSTPTVIGRFHVYLKTPGVNSEGMVDSNYFIRGYAIHGYPSVPDYPASHGCLRIPIPDAPAVFAWVAIGDPVDVYYEDGQGSRVASANAGP